MSVKAEAIKHLFRITDIDNDGFLSRAELHELFKTLGLHDKTLDQTFDHCDASHDGKLSFDEFVDWLFVTGAPLSDPSEPELRLLQLQAKSKNFSFSLWGTSIGSEFATLFQALPDEAVGRVRGALDSNLVFTPASRQHIDLRYLVFEELSEQESQQVLRRIHNACAPPPASCQGFVVLSDVDDTLLPGHDKLGIAGTDRSCDLDGRLYPGALRLHTELRGFLGSNRDYSVLLTARPPMLCASLAAKFHSHSLSGFDVPRLAILPGASGVSMAINAVSILASSYSTLGKTKLARVKEYSLLFPDYAGRFVFLGDDGQADRDIADDMLSSRVPRLRDDGKVEPGDKLLFAFVAIHAVMDSAGSYKYTEEQRASQVSDLRAKHAAVKPPASISVPHGHPAQCIASTPGCSDKALPIFHRFFYFLDYADLAQQLANAGWITSRQKSSILQAVSTDVQEHGPHWQASA